MVRDRDALFLEPPRQFNASNLGHRASVDRDAEFDEFCRRGHFTTEPTDLPECVLSCEPQEFFSGLVVTEYDLDPEFSGQPTDEEALWV